MLCNKKSNKNENKKPIWFDEECWEMKKEKYYYLKLFCSTGMSSFYHTFKLLRSKFKKLVRTKETDHINKLRDNLEKSINDSQEFWSFVKRNISSHLCENNQPRISAKEWFNHYKNLLNSNNEVDRCWNMFVKNYIKHHDKNCAICNNPTTISDYSPMNECITVEEVEQQINSLKNKKAHGIDGILNEAIKVCRGPLKYFLTTFLNKIFRIACMPSVWCKSMIVSIFKQGNKIDTNNYRGISLLSNLSKIFTGILNKRIVSFTEERKLIGENQGGFREGRGTVENLFILKTLTDKQLMRKRGKLYCLFVDFSKAFDTVNHSLLTYLLIKSGFHGKILKMLQKIYANMYFCVKSMKGLTKSFKCNTGVRQGCLLSPRLFLLFIEQFYVF